MARACALRKTKPYKSKHHKKPKAKNLGIPLTRSYRSRRESLLAMGYKTYTSYLNSELWKGIRESVLSDNPYCIRCGCRASQVHHAFYTVKTLSGTDMSKLYSICGDCHYKAEHDHTGKKTTLGRANRFLGICNRKGGWTRRENRHPNPRPDG